MGTIALLLSLFFVALTIFFSSRRRRNLPPGPYPLPIIGNILQLRAEPQVVFADLSKKYGPLMSIHLGSLYTVIVSSPEMAKEILQKHGQVFSGRTIPHGMHACDHHRLSMAFLPVSKPWRDMRKICKEHMFSHQSLESSQGLRQQKLQLLLDYLQKCSERGRAVDIRKASSSTTINLVSATMFSAQDSEFESKYCQELNEMVHGVALIGAVTNFGDYFPILKPFDLQGIKRKADGNIGRLLKLIEGHLNERMESRKGNPNAPRKNDFLEIVVDILEANEFELSTHHFTHLMLDLFVGGSATNTTSIEWIMSDLVDNPDKMAKLKQELRSVVGDRKLVDESEIPRLPYLQAVIKEALRLHSAPLLVPRKAEADQEVNGYLIPKGTQVLFNAWAMGRDPTIWKNPASFEPERFLDQEIDFKGQDFQLIPFGSGRRICPGFPLADRILHTATAAMVHNFDWKLEEAAGEGDHKKDRFELSFRRAVPLRIIPLKPLF